MAHSANRSIDFAPAWLKLPENNQNSKKQESTHNPSYQQSHSHRHSISHPEQHYPPNDTPHHNLFQRSSSSTSNHHHHHPRPGGRQHHINTYRQGPPSGPQHPLQLQRSQSTGSYNDSIASRTVPTAVASSNAPPAPTVTPLEEEFPLLCSGMPATPATLNQSQPSNQVSTTAQWRIKDKTREDNNKSGSSTNHLNDNLLTSNMSGKVYRAQVKPVKRTNMISINNGGATGNIAIKSRENGQHNDHSTLSSSLDREKKFLQELGWNEDEESDDDDGIPEQDPAELQQIMMEAKAARQRLLLKNKQSMKSVASAMLPNEDDLPSSSDNSDNE